VTISFLSLSFSHWHSEFFGFFLALPYSTLLPPLALPLNPGAAGWSGFQLKPCLLIFLRFASFSVLRAADRDLCPTKDDSGCIERNTFPEATANFSLSVFHPHSPNGSTTPAASISTPSLQMAGSLTFFSKLSSLSYSLIVYKCPDPCVLLRERVSFLL